MTRRGPALLLVALGAGVLALTYAGLQAPDPGQFGFLHREHEVFYAEVTIAAGLLYMAAVVLVRARPLPGWALPIILLVGLAARTLVLAAPPMLSTDLYRYVWDGRVQAAGINPYRYIPADPALAALRDAPVGSPSNPTAIYPNINRVDSAPTIYPPAAQAMFALLGLTWSSIWSVKAAMLGLDMLGALAALALLRVAERPPAQVVIWAWNPLLIWELAGGGHIDAGALAFSTLAILAAAVRRPAWAGAALAVAVLFKLLPAALFPALWRRWDWRTPAAAATVVVAAYLPYSGVGLRVFGYLPGYANEEGLDGSKSILFRALGLSEPIPHWLGLVYDGGGLLILTGLAAWVALRRPFPESRPARAELIARDALILSAALLAILLKPLLGATTHASVAGRLRSCRKYSKTVGKSGGTAAKLLNDS